MMPKPFLVFLLTVFSIHLAIFLRLAVRYRRDYHFLAVATFTLLLISTGVRLLWSQAYLGRYPLYAYFKYTAWLTTAAMVIAYLRHKYFK